MTHQTHLVEICVPCPRCSSKQARISTYHFGATYKAECSQCAMGHEITGDTQAMAVARLVGKYLEVIAETKAQIEKHTEDVGRILFEHMTGRKDWTEQDETCQRFYRRIVHFFMGTDAKVCFPEDAAQKGLIQDKEPAASQVNGAAANWPLAGVGTL